ncbi:hypothetical protein TraAM80_07276 [Trypanosoma rangeli]|uniref:Uncharacterized protein n=1 Tax=Trypanosoma rangeli TaxID=5698 RepID=A0A3R7KTF1_TRYRA|nr:uncharacterized protein TraAM80_07276 [Trypanosoma rangeli]RNF01002.1 hypothetical protein TraAM80_07276 [Trypanosoma rangeli]|eukprot:RNF01002.1 hypothetical protein TraAM80_07276 [Trypanosoma rangeli]
MPSWVGLRGMSDSFDGNNFLKYDKIKWTAGRDCGSPVRTREEDSGAKRSRTTWAVSKSGGPSSKMLTRCLPGEFLEGPTYIMALKRFVVLAALTCPAVWLAINVALAREAHKELCSDNSFHEHG